MSVLNPPSPRSDNCAFWRFSSVLERTVLRTALAAAVLWPGTAVSQSIEEMVSWTGTLQLAESREAMIVAPHAVGTASVITIADLREFRVSQFSHDGRRLRVAGGRGGGPGEFESPPLTARPTSNGGLLVAEFGGRLHLFGPTGDSARTTRVPIFPFYDATALDGDRVLLVGWGPVAQRERAQRGQLLHEWSMREQRILKSYFELPVPDALLPAARSFGNVATAIRGDTAFAVFTLTDTVCKFSVTSDNQTGKVPIRSSLLKRAVDAPPALASAEARNKWMESVSVIDAPYHPRDGRLLVQFSERFGAVRKYRLLLLNAEGEVSGQASEAPQLMAAYESGANTVLLFANRDDDEPNVWRKAELRH